MVARRDHDEKMRKLWNPLVFRAQPTAGLKETYIRGNEYTFTKCRM